MATDKGWKILKFKQEFSLFLLISCLPKVLHLCVCRYVGRRRAWHVTQWHRRLVWCCSMRVWQRFINNNRSQLQSFSHLPDLFRGGSFLWSEQLLGLIVSRSCRHFQLLFFCFEEDATCCLLFLNIWQLLLKPYSRLSFCRQMLMMCLLGFESLALAAP